MTTVLLTLAVVLLLVLAVLVLCVAVLLGLMYYRVRQMRNQIDVIFDTAANTEEFLAGMSADRGFLSAN